MSESEKGLDRFEQTREQKRRRGMIKRPYTKYELLSIYGISYSDKRLIEQIVSGIVKDDDDTLEKQYIRGYMVQQTERTEIDGRMREDFVLDSSSFDEGWQAAVQEFDKLLKPFSDANIVDVIYKNFKERFSLP